MRTLRMDTVNDNVHLPISPLLRRRQAPARQYSDIIVDIVN